MKHKCLKHGKNVTELKPIELFFNVKNISILLNFNRVSMKHFEIHSQKLYSILLFWKHLDNQILSLNRSFVISSNLPYLDLNSWSKKKTLLKLCKSKPSLPVLPWKSLTINIFFKQGSKQYAYLLDLTENIAPQAQIWRP